MMQVGTKCGFAICGPFTALRNKSTVGSGDGCNSFARRNCHVEYAVCRRRAERDGVVNLAMRSSKRERRRRRREKESDEVGQSLNESDEAEGVSPISSGMKSTSLLPAKKRSRRERKRELEKRNIFSIPKIDREFVITAVTRGTWIGLGVLVGVFLVVHLVIVKDWL